MVEGGCDTSYFSIGDGWVIARRGWILARTFPDMIEPAAETGVRGPPEEGSDVDEKVGEGVSRKASAKWTCFPGIVEIKCSSCGG